MQKTKGFSKPWLIAGIAAVILIVGGIVYLAARKNQATIHYEDYDTFSVVEPGDYNGNIAEHIEGNPDAPLIIYEYANFQCNHCAGMHPLVTQATKDYDGQIGVVFRNFTWSAFPNSKAAAAAAEAAGLQGHWQDYADKLFAEQVEWSYSTGTERTELFEKYLTEVAGEDADLEKFRSDIESDAVAQKIKFDNAMGKQAEVGGTPAFYVDGQFIDMANGGTLTLSNGKTVTFEKFDENNDFLQLIKELIAAKTSE